MTSPQTKTKTIDGITFTLEPVGAWEAIPLFHSLVAILGTMTPLLGDILGGDKGKTVAERVNLVRLFEVLPSFLERASPEKIRSLAESMLATCLYRLPSARGKQSDFDSLLPSFDSLMRGRVLTIFKLLGWAIEVNFSDFFSGAKLALAAKQRVASAEASVNATASQPSEPTPPDEG